MKVLQVGSSLYDWGGIERYLVYLAEGLSARGHDVSATIPPGSRLESRFPARKHPIGLRSQFDFTKLPAYLRLFRRERFDVVNVHFSPDYIVPAVAARIAKQPNLLLTRHVALPWKPSRVRRYTRLYKGFIAVSDAVKTKLVESGIPSQDVVVAHAGIPALTPTLARVAMREQLAINGFAAGFFGRIVEDKGVQTLMAAAPQLPPETFHVFGDGPMLEPYKGQGSGVRFHSRVEDVTNAMNAMDVVVVPSLWEEAFGFSALEAMSLGKPVVVSRSGGLIELVRDGENGYVFPKGDAKALAQILQNLATDPAQLARLGEAAQAFHENGYTLADMGRRMEEAYQAFI